MSELEASDDNHPLKPASEMSFSNLSIADSVDPNKLAEEIDSVAVDWKSLRNVTACSCGSPFDQFSKKVRFLGSLDVNVTKTKFPHRVTAGSVETFSVPGV